MITEVNEALNRKLEALRQEKERLEAEVASLLFQRDHLVEVKRSLERVFREHSSPCVIFYKGDRHIRVENRLYEEHAKLGRLDVKGRRR